MEMTGTPGRAVRTPKQRRGQETREAILRAAESLFERRGYDEVTTTDIAREAGVAVGSVYAYFPDKPTILCEVFDRSAGEIARAIAPTLDPATWDTGDGRTLIRRAIHAVVDSHRLRPGLQRVLLEATLKDPAVAATYRTLELELIRAMEGLLRALDRRTRVRDPHVAAYVIFHAVEACCHQCLLLGDPMDLDALEDHLVDMVARFLLRERPRRGGRKSSR
jgi:AcrR family transcriptional regulator